MIDHLIQVCAHGPPEVRRNLAREYLHVYLLRVLHERGALAQLAFVGGTALRILFSLPRFSEDLDFCLAPPGEGRSPAFDPDTLFPTLKPALEKAGYRVTLRARSKRAVASAFVWFEGVPHRIGASPDPRLALSVKIEIDTNPPPGALVETTLIQRFFPVALRHHDLPSLFAGKLHALLARSYAKGRDWYDLVWYLTEQRGLQPNTELLRNALRQTGHPVVWADAWRAQLRERLAALDWDTVERDVRPFLERASDLEPLTPAGIRDLLG